MKDVAVFLLLLIVACDSTYSTTTVCLDEDMNLLTRDEHIHERDIYDDEDSCEEAGGTWYWECKESGELHAIPDSEYPLYNGAESNQDVCPR